MHPGGIVSTRSRIFAHALAVLAFACATPAFAALRSPQVPVLGGRLQSYMNAQGETFLVGSVCSAPMNSQL